MRIVCISDTHSLHSQLSIPEGDLLIHAGDCLNHGTLDELLDFNTWLGTLPHRFKILSAGNHDYAFQDNPTKARALVTNATYLEDEGVQIEHLFLWGSPWTPRFFNMALNATRGPQIADRWDQNPSKTDILVTHGPPWGIRDEIQVDGRIKNVGCQDLRETVANLRLKLHVFGHVHKGYGSEHQEDCTYINACNCSPKAAPRYCAGNQRAGLSFDSWSMTRMPPPGSRPSTDLGTNASASYSQNVRIKHNGGR